MHALEWDGQADEWLDNPITQAPAASDLYRGAKVQEAERRGKSDHKMFI